MMSQQEFDAIYPKGLTTKQNKVLERLLKGELDQTIAKDINPQKKIKPYSVSRHISNICQSFNIKNEPGGGYTQREELILLFVKYKPKLVCQELLKEYG